MDSLIYIFMILNYNLRIVVPLVITVILLFYLSLGSLISNASESGI